MSSFARAAGSYARDARLQQGVAWRLASLCRDLVIPAGPVIDLGAGSGNLSRALITQRPDLQPLLVDNCAELLNEAAVPPERSLHWDLNAGLPPQAHGAALLLSSFALHWLQEPAQQLRHWSEQLQPGGWLALAVPVAGSLASWHEAARRAGVPCSALPLPSQDELVAALPMGLQRLYCQRLRFSCRYPKAELFLNELKRLGVNGGATSQLKPGELRRLLLHWPAPGDKEGVSLNWDLLVLLTRRDEH